MRYRSTRKQMSLSQGQIKGRFHFPVDHLSVYQQFVMDHVRQALERLFPILFEVTSGPLWNQIVLGYFDSLPESQYDFPLHVSGFPPFLRRELDAGRLELSGFHVELAELEWNESVVRNSQSTLPLVASFGFPVLNPTLVILEVDYPIVDFLDRWELEESFRDQPEIPEPLESSAFVFLFREPSSGFAVLYEGREDLLFVFKIVHERLGLEEAARLGELSLNDVKSFVDRAIRIGLVFAPEGYFDL